MNNIYLQGAAVTMAVGMFAVGLSVLLIWANWATKLEWMATAGLWLALIGCASGITTTLYGIMYLVTL